MIELVDLCVFYGKQEIIRGVNAKIEEKVLLLGPNGSGKSTLLRAIAGVIGYKGHIFIDGQEVSKLRNYNILSTNLAEAYYLGLSVKDTVYLYEEIKGVDPELFTEMLNRIGLSNIVNKRWYHLSVGQKVIASDVLALASKPKILLLDEPFENVDLGKRRVVAGWIREYGREGIIVTHEVDIVRLFKDYKVYMIFEGRLFGPVSADDFLNASVIEGEDPSAVLTVEVGGRKFSFVKGDKGYRVENLISLDRIYNIGG
ncbi:ATP-binding cassette domain-containing protein [Stygiolobus caldivivus]|uniref:Mn2+/Zn2+ABC transporter ATP-binding protein n=1 Tax=Stygiolobus caldivivus TaxID=2824673 RepID=A0A8D5U658_9CREN|nr:ATP-binding cassette domain-containing protein [Stygiolobus caldivivus]BCU69743.1 Mn2+/Zn2+ABC transporter ATP-binding protein [Stygiolobus caldivivus]